MKKWTALPLWKRTSLSRQSLPGMNTRYLSIWNSSKPNRVVFSAKLEQKYKEKKTGICFRLSFTFLKTCSASTPLELIFLNTFSVDFFFSLAKPTPCCWAFYFLYNKLKKQIKNQTQKKYKRKFFVRLKEVVLKSTSKKLNKLWSFG